MLSELQNEQLAFLISSGSETAPLAHPTKIQRGEREEKKVSEFTSFSCHLISNITAYGQKKVTHSRVDLPVLISHAVSVVQVGEGFGCSPGLEIAGHSDRCSHLCSIQSVSGMVMMLRASTFHLDRHEEGAIYWAVKTFFGQKWKQEAAILCQWCHFQTKFLSNNLWIDDQICDDAMLLQVRVSLLSIPVFHFISTIQMLQCDWGDVNSPVEENIEAFLFPFSGEW